MEASPKFNTSFLARTLSFTQKSLYAFKMAKMISRDQLNSQMILTLKHHALDTQIDLLNKP